MKEPYDSLLCNIRNCSDCLFRDLKIKPLAPNVAPNPVPIMFIGENPSWEKVQNVPFGGNTISGRALNEHYLKPLGLIRNQVWITDLFKCRYPKHIKRDKNKNRKIIQKVVGICVYKWLIQEIKLAKPLIIVTLSNKEVYQHIRRIFNLSTPAKFEKAVGKSHTIVINNREITLFPMIHPDISRPLGNGDYRKIEARKKWSPIHKNEHIPSLKELLKRRGKNNPDHRMDKKAKAPAHRT